VTEPAQQGAHVLAALDQPSTMAPPIAPALCRSCDRLPPTPPCRGHNLVPRQATFALFWLTRGTRVEVVASAKSARITGCHVRTGRQG
jgi:hypothetical protein